MIGSQEEWEKRNRVVEIVSNDSVLTGNRSRRYGFGLSEKASSNNFSQ